MLKNILIVAIGGSLGSVARYLCQKYIHEWNPGPFPVGTFLVNISGCFLIGIFYGLAEKGQILGADARLFLATGFCGGFTTFSAFALENVNLMKSGNLLYFGLYAAGSVILGIAATWLGIVLTQ